MQRGVPAALPDASTRTLGSYFDVRCGSESPRAVSCRSNAICSSVRWKIPLHEEFTVNSWFIFLNFIFFWVHHHNHLASAERRKKNNWKAEKRVLFTFSTYQWFENHSPVQCCLLSVIQLIMFMAHVISRVKIATSKKLWKQQHKRELKNITFHSCIVLLKIVNDIVYVSY